MFSGIPAETPFDLRWWMFGVHIRVHPLHWLFSALLGWSWYERPGGGLGYVTLWVACVFVSVLLHELGHVMMGRLFGTHGNIVLFSLGGLAIGASDLRSRWQRILVYLAGPLVQFVLLGLVIAAEFFLLPLAPENWHPYADVVLFMLSLINLFWPLLNLLPIWPLDGGKISREVFDGLLGHKGVVLSLWLSIGLSGVLAVQVLMNSLNKSFIPYLSWLDGGMYMALFFAMFCLTGYQALQYENNRRRSRYEDELPWEKR